MLLIKQNEAGFSRWLREDRSGHSYQCSKEPFIKVLSDLRPCIYQSLLINGVTLGRLGSLGTPAPAPSWQGGSEALAGMPLTACWGVGCMGGFPRELECVVTEDQSCPDDATGILPRGGHFSLGK